MGKKLVLVTGAAGFIGRHCAKELSLQGYTTIGVDICSFPDASKWGIDVFQKNNVSNHNLEGICKLNGLPSCIIHCAGSGSVPYSYVNPCDDFYKNVETTIEILEFSRRSGGISVVLPSSAAVYGIAKNLPIREDTYPNPVSPYGVHKRLAEEVVMSFSKYFDVPTAIIRFFSVYGIGLQK